MAKKDWNMVPRPMKLLDTGKTFRYQKTLRVALEGELECLREAISSICGEEFYCVDDVSGDAKSSVTFCKEEQLEHQLGSEGYLLSVREDGVVVTYAACAGAFYALMTLRQMAMRQKPCAAGGIFELACCEIEDKPELRMRGMMLDVSRGKVPTLETLKQVVDLLASLKYNHLELYFEGFSFAYPSFPEYWREDGALKPKEIKELDAYCKARFVDLVPNQNCLGHMAPWLAREEYARLAELEGGFYVGDWKVPPMTLDARDERSLELVRKMTEDMAKCFTSPYFHAAMDEPFEMGRGKNKAFVEEHGKAALFSPYVQKIHEMLREKGRRMMMWGDVAAKNSDVLDGIPEDVIIMDWGYEAEHPVEKRAKTLRDSGHAFCLCPGTNSWTSFTGITDNMISCIHRTARAAKDYGAYGAMLTDWGDSGHMQYLPVSYAAIVLAGGLFWNVGECDLTGGVDSRNDATSAEDVDSGSDVCSEDGVDSGSNACSEDGVDSGSDAGSVRNADDTMEERLADALNCYVFQDANHVMGALALHAGNYARLEEFRLPCTTMAGVTFKTGDVTREALEGNIAMTMRLNDVLLDEEVAEPYRESYQNRVPMQKERLLAFFDELEERLGKTDLRCADGNLIIAEYQNAFHMLRILTEIRALMMEDEEDVSEMQAEPLRMEERQAKYKDLVNQIEEMLVKHRGLWMKRNKAYGVEQGEELFRKLQRTLLEKIV